MGFEKALGAVKMIKDQIQYRSQSLLNLARGYLLLSDMHGICHTVSANKGWAQAFSLQLRSQESEAPEILRLTFTYASAGCPKTCTEFWSLILEQWISWFIIMTMGNTGLGPLILKSDWFSSGSIFPYSDRSAFPCQCSLQTLRLMWLVILCLFPFMAWLIKFTGHFSITGIPYKSYHQLKHTFKVNVLKSTRSNYV